jgi:hypothetical protein
MMSGMYGVLSEIAIRDGGAKLLKGLVSLMVRHRASPVSGDIVPEPPERGARLARYATIIKKNRDL